MGDGRGLGVGCVEDGGAKGGGEGGNSTSKGPGGSSYSFTHSDIALLTGTR